MGEQTLSKKLKHVGEKSADMMLSPAREHSQSTRGGIRKPATLDTPSRAGS